MKLLAAFVAVTLSISVARTQATPPKSPSPAKPAETTWVFGDLELLPGYVASAPSSENPFWTISKKDGVTIRYQGGNVANVVHDWITDAARDGKVSWTKQQIVNGRIAKIAATKDGRMLIHIAPFNFEAKVDTIEQATDLLLMVLTYGAGDAHKPPEAR